MDDELVLLTSYFNLVDGQRQDEADTFRVDTNLQSASSPDGSAALYIVTESSTGGNIGPRARRLAADTIAWEYASHGEDPPVARLKAALRVAHEEVRREFEGHVAIGATVMAVERDTVYLAQVAPSQVYVLHEGSLHSIPAVMEADSPFARALGAEAGPKISVFRDEIAHGDVVSLCSTWFDRSADAGDIRNCFGAGTSDEIAESLLDLAQEHGVRDATAVVVEATLSTEIEVVPRGDEPPTFMEQVDIAVQALASVGRMLWHELQPFQNGDTPQPRVEAPHETIRTAAATGPAATPAPSASASADTSEVPLVPGGLDEVTVPLPPEPDTVEPDGIEPEPELERTEYRAPRVNVPEPEAEAPEPQSSRRDDMTEEVPRVPPPTRRPDELPLNREGARPVRPPSSDVDEIETETHSAAPENTPQDRRHLADEESVPSLSELERVNSRLGESQDMADVIPPVQAFEDTGTEPARIYATSKDIQAANKRPRRFAGAGSVPVIRPGLGDIDLRQPVTRSTPPAVVWASLAVLLIFIAGALGYFVRNQLANQHHANAYIPLVVKDISRAKSGSSPAQQDAYLNRAQKNLALAAENGASTTWVAARKQEIQTTSDSIHHITRETSPLLLTDFSKFPGAQPSEIATAPGQVYVVDPKRKSAFSVAAQANATPTAIFQSGESYSGFTVSAPQHIATDGGVALMVDDKNQLFRDTAGTKTGTALVQVTPRAAHNVSMTTLDPDVYLLDTASSQVWRYPYAVSGFNPREAAYWDENPPKLGNGVSIAFDKTDLYILRSDGTVLKYDLQANPVKFTINLQTPLSNPVSLYTDGNQNWVWIADPVHKRIVQLDKSGGYSRTYLSANSGLDLSKTRSISVGPDGKTLYVLAGSKLYDFPVTQ